MKIFLSSLVFSFLISFNNCNQKRADEPCFTDRSVAETLKDVEIKCTADGEQYLLFDEKEKTRFAVCNNDHFEFNLNAYYIISGVTYEVKPYERWAGTPLQLASARQKE